MNSLQRTGSSAELDGAVSHSATGRGMFGPAERPWKSSLWADRAPGGGPMERIPVCSWKLISAPMEKVSAKGGGGRGSPRKPPQARGWRSVSCPSPHVLCSLSLPRARPFHVPYVQRSWRLTHGDVCAPQPEGRGSHSDSGLGSIPDTSSYSLCCLRPT